MKYTYKQPPLTLYNVVALECWLSDLALKGLVFDGITLGLYRFRKDSPQVVQYRVEPLLNNCTQPSSELCDAYASAGWTFIVSPNHFFSIWYATDPDAQELHSDPIVQSQSYHRICSQLKRSVIRSSLFLLAMLAIVVVVFIFWERPVLTLLSISSPLIALLLNLLALLSTLCSARSAFKIKRMLSEGIPLSHHKQPRKTFWGYAILEGISFCFVTIMLISGYFVVTTSWCKNVVEFDGPLPLLSLDIIEQTDTFAWAAPSVSSNSTIDRNNYVEYSWELFVPVHYEILQKGAIEPHMFPDKSDFYHPSASTDYYELRFEVLAPIIFEELMSQHLYMPLSTYNIQEIDQFDRTVIATEGYTTHLFVQQGKQVLYIRYRGYADLSAYLDLLEPILDSLLVAR